MWVARTLSGKGGAVAGSVASSIRRSSKPRPHLQLDDQATTDEGSELPITPKPSAIKSPMSSSSVRTSRTASPSKRVQFSSVEAMLSDGSTVYVEDLSSGSQSCDGASSSSEPAQAWTQEEEEMLAIPHDFGTWGEHVKLAIVKGLHKAPRNNGVVDLMMSETDGHFVAVKKVPNNWLKTNPQEFVHSFPEYKECMWLDLSIMRYLNQQSFRYTCQVEGLFADSSLTYVVSSYADQGDLFDWAALDNVLGPDREEKMRPLVGQICDAMQWLHDHDIAHRDICLENILLASSSGTPMVKIIDFGMATVGRRWSSGCYGGKGYQAPEMHTSPTYDSFLSDVFAVGVVVFAMATHDHLWRSTRPGECKHFGYVAKNGLRKFFTRRHVGQEGKMLSQVLSSDLVDLLEQLLAVDVTYRASFGEQCFGGCGGNRLSVWEAPWLSSPACPPGREYSL